MSSKPESGPLFTIISAVYNVARYLPDFINSVENQTFDLNRVEVIMVDDGSTDESGAILAAWQERAPGLVRVLTKGNGGQGSARNLGIDHASGDWVTFTDPDDMLASNYLEQIAAFLANTSVQPKLLAGAQIVYDEVDDRLVDSHPLRARFRGADQLVDLDRFPNYFHMHISSAFLWREALIASELKFDDRVRPQFEDGHVIARYLLDSDRPLVAFVGSAKYHYRRRADQTSTLQTSSRHASKFTAVLRFGYLDVLEKARSKSERVPKWLQNEIIYELNWFLRAEEVMFGGLNAADHGVETEFHDLMRQVLGHIDTESIEQFSVLNMPPIRVAALAYGYRDEPWHEDGAVIDRFDPEQGLLRISYLYCGSAPAEEFRLRGVPSQPVHAKTRAQIYSGVPVVFERILWVRADGTIELRVDDVLVPLRRHRPKHKVSWRPVEIRRAFGLDPTVKEQPNLFERLRDRMEGAVTGSDEATNAASALRARRMEHLRSNKRFADAWLLMDRDMNANDNAEHLYRFLRKERPEINAWFTVRAGTPAFKRLKKEGLGNLVEHGSAEWVALSLNAEHLISSHIDHYVVRPSEVLRFGDPAWRYTFLQHGVIKDDLSAWLNGKPIDLMLASTEPEFASLVGDDSPYRLTTREVALTGLPRHDRLSQLGRETTSDKRRTILVIPTWRHYLVGPLKPGSGWERELIPDFDKTEYCQTWTRLLGSARLQDAAAAAGLSLTFLPHPNIEPYLDQFQVPGNVSVVAMSSADIQRLLAESALVITDYSSIAFDAALIERPVLYFQFDRATVFGGGHITKPGYFSYHKHGFGPVCHDLPSALSALDQVLLSRRPANDYLDRIHKTFPYQEGGNCERVVEALLALRKPKRTTVVAPQAPPIDRSEV